MALDKKYWKQIDRLLAMAIEEDIGPGDVTTDSLIPEKTRCACQFVARAPGVMAGLEVVTHFYGILEPDAEITREVREGLSFDRGAVLATIRGPARGIFTGERIALNILQHLCGIATRTREFVKAVEGTGAKICDTRKTLPGWRMLEKLAVFLGGGENHRRNLHEMVLIKDNHIGLAARTNAVASPAWAVRLAREETGLTVQIEVESPEELRQILLEEPEMALLDNMTLEQLRECVELARTVCAERKLRRPLLEASGGVTLATVRAVAETGVDRISVGAITHSAPALDIGLDLLESGA